VVGIRDPLSVLSGGYKNNQWHHLSRHSLILSNETVTWWNSTLDFQVWQGLVFMHALWISPHLVICVIQLHISVNIHCFLIYSLWFCSLECKNNVSTPELLVGTISFVFERSRGGISIRVPPILTGGFLYFLETTAWKISHRNPWRFPWTFSHIHDMFKCLWWWLVTGHIIIIFHILENWLFQTQHFGMWISFRCLLPTQLGLLGKTSLDNSISDLQWTRVAHSNGPDWAETFPPLHLITDIGPNSDTLLNSWFALLPCN
jgi:hypothetical protein